MISLLQNPLNGGMPAIDIEPILPEPLVPAWSFLQDYPVLLVVLMFGIGLLAFFYGIVADQAESDSD